MILIQQAKEAWKFRALVGALVGRHVSSRYRGSLLGFLWSLMNPLCLMLVYTLVFHHYMRFSTDERYHIMLFSGLLPWIWSTSSLSEGTSAIVSSGHLITKSLFPAHLLPLVSTLSNGINFLLSLPILAVFMWAAGMSIPATWLLMPIVVIVHLLILHGLNLTLSSLNVFYRDVQHIVGNTLTFLFFLTPIVYPSTVVPERWRILLLLNPFALLTEIYRQILLKNELPAFSDCLVLGVFAGFFMLTGSLVYEMFRERFAESL